MSDINRRIHGERSSKLAKVVYENSAESIVITDEHAIVVDVNPAFTKTTGYEKSEIIGHSMNVLSSGHQSSYFYQKMWQEIKQTGRWQGEMLNKRKNGELYSERLNISTCYNEDGSVYRYIGMFFDITRYKEREELIWRQANHDHLTDLPNRQRFQSYLHDVMLVTEKNNKQFALIFLDLDSFKDVNDNLGHDVGDLLLKKVSERLLSCIRASDLVARVGGDEFTLIVTDIPDQKVIERICEQILTKIAHPYDLGGKTVHVSASIGVTIYPEDATDAVELLKNADIAMYESKQRGPNQYRLFLPAMSQAIQERLRLTKALQNALTENQFVLYYQPIVDMSTGVVKKIEALIRWQHPELGLISPADYIPFAEDSGHIVQIGEWVFYTAVQQAKKLQAKGYYYPISINVSPVQFYENGINVEHWVKTIQEAGLTPRSITIEITEGVFLEESQRVSRNLQQLQQAGFLIALDDFGTGFSSLTYLQRYHIDMIKIDQTFVSHLTSGQADNMILCEALLMFVKKLGLEVIAEGVENMLQQELLLKGGCLLGQGYLYSRPIPPQELELWLAERNNTLPASNNNNKDQIITGQLPTRT